jgi:peptide/nickel transport system substrate-binding protein
MHRKVFFAALVLLLFSVVSIAMVGAQDDATYFSGAWPYQVPPDGHFNTYASGNMNLGIYRGLMEPRLATYIWAEGTYEPLMAESFGFEDDGNYVVTLRNGVTWTDGNPVTAEDLAATINTGYLIGALIWTSLDSVEVVDDMTVRYHLNEQSPLVERRILTEFVRPASVYGQFAEQAVALLEAGVVSGDAEFEEALTSLTQFRPDTFVAAGPYQLLSENISDASVRLVRHEGGLNSDLVQFDEILVWNGETETVTPLVANGELWYATHGFPPATESAFVDAGIDIVRGPGYSGPALYINHNVYPLNRVEVRQAMAYAIDREENGFVSLAESGIAVECMCGFSDNLAATWLGDEVAGALNTYDYDPDMAASILEDIGFSRGGDGVWVDDNGDRLAFELIFPAEFLDWAAAAENATAQLNDFGFDITARGVQFQQQEQEVYDSNFQLAVRNWGLATPFPGDSFLEPYRRYNGQGELAGEGVGGGMNYDVNVTFSGGTVDVQDAAIRSNQGTDHEAQVALVEQLALSYNELLPAVPLWERYGNNPLNRDFVDAPDATDPIYRNPWGTAADGFIPYLILTGRLGPAAGM